MMRFVARVFLLSIFLLHQSFSSCNSFPLPVIDPTKVKQISWRPRAFVYEGFLTEEESDHMISIARLELKRSAVADNVSGQSKLSEVRTSSGMFIPRKKDSIVAGIEEKIAAWTFLPDENGEDMQVLRYEYGQKYDPHFDYFTDKSNIARGGHRMATVLMYLSDVVKGGETVFPYAEDWGQVPWTGNFLNDYGINDCRCLVMHIVDGGIGYKSYDVPANGTIPSKDEDLSECARRGIAVKPKRGNALLFFNLHPNATPDPQSLHGGCPVIEGEKWSATKWIHVFPFDKIIPVDEGGDCKDANENCERWANLGECSKNPEYMVGTIELPGFCRRSCRMC